MTIHYGAFELKIESEIRTAANVPVKGLNGKNVRAGHQTAQGQRACRAHIRRTVIIRLIRVAYASADHVRRISWRSTHVETKRLGAVNPRHKAVVTLMAINEVTDG